MVRQHTNFQAEYIDALVHLVGIRIMLKCDIRSVRLTGGQEHNSRLSGFAPAGGWLTAQLTNRGVDARRLDLPRRIGDADIVSDVISKTLTLVETQSSLLFLILLT
jgi:hypothetical protein